MAAAAVGAARRQIFHIKTYLLIEISSISSISEAELQPQPQPPLETVGCAF